MWDGDEPGVFSPPQSPHPLVQAKKKKNTSFNVFYLLKSKCPRIVLHHHSIFLHHFKRGREASNILSFCNAGRFGTRTFDSAGVPDRRPQSPTISRHPRSVTSVYLQPFCSPAEDKQTSVVLSRVSLSCRQLKTNPNVSVLLTALSYFIVYAREKILGTIVCIQLAAK